MDRFWVPGVEMSLEQVEELHDRSGASSDAPNPFKYRLEYEDPPAVVTAAVGHRWPVNRPSSSPEERRQRRDWMVFAIVQGDGSYVIWKLDVGSTKRRGEGWSIAAIVPGTAVLKVQDFEDAPVTARVFRYRRR